MGLQHFGHIAGVISALSTPVAIFDPQRGLVRYNEPYAKLFDIEPDELVVGTDERRILDKLRTRRMLPDVVSYRDWREQHLTSYDRRAPWQHEPWHLPDGRTIKVISAPAGPEGGVIYVFEDITSKLQLESLNKALVSVQRETLNSLGEAVSVFGTNGRLTLANTRFFELWRISETELQGQHVDGIIEATARSTGASGAGIWRGLRREVLNLQPTRHDLQGQVERDDGVVLDYRLVRLPDGQTMLSFSDVSHRAQLTRVTKERDAALKAAVDAKSSAEAEVDRLRRPISEIIELAESLVDEDLLLTDRQIASIQDIKRNALEAGGLVSLNTLVGDVVPEQRPGLAFELSREGVIDLSLSGVPDAEEFKQLEGLLPVLVGALDDLLVSSEGSNAFPQISPIARKYKEVAAGQMGNVAIDQLYAYGVRLGNIGASINRSIAGGEGPETSDGLSEALESVLTIHGTLVLSTKRGRYLLRAAQAYREDKSNDLEYKLRAQDVVGRLSKTEGLVSDKAKAVVVEINDDIAQGIHPSRSTEIARTANYNLFATMGKVVLVGYFGQAYLQSVPGIESVSSGAQVVNYSWQFLVDNEVSIRALASIAGQEMHWVSILLDWVKKHRLSDVPEAR
jgi:PAS domain-containing protein